MTTELLKSMWWYVARSSGIVAWVLFTLTSVWGIFSASKFWQAAKRPKPLLELHRWLAALAWGFTALHMVALWADSYIEFGPLELLIPGASSWKRGAVGVGVVGFWLLMVVQLTSLIQKRLSRQTWKRIHLASYLAWWATTVHGILAGTDADQVIFRSTTAAGVTVLASLATYRLLTRRSPRLRAEHGQSRRNVSVSSASIDREQ